MENTAAGRLVGTLMKRPKISGVGLRFKLASIVVLGFFLSFAIVAWLNFSSQSRQMESFAAETTRALTGQLGQQMAASLKFQRTERLRDIYDTVLKNKKIHLQDIVVLDSEGAVVDQLKETGSNVSELVALGRKVLNSGEAEVVQDNGLIQVAQTVRTGKDNETVGAVVILWDLTYEMGLLLRNSMIALGVASIAMLAGLGGIMLSIGKMVSGPLLRVTNAIERIADGDYVTAVPDIERTDEIGRISRHLSAFRDRLAEEERARAERAASEARKHDLFDHLSACLGQVSEGDLSPRVDVAMSDGLGDSYRQVCYDLNTLLENFSDVMLTVVGTAESVRASAIEISQVADAQSQRSEAQASTLEESAAALDELTNSVKSAAVHAAEADNAVAENRRQAEASGDIVRNAIAAMKQIEESSSQITQIIGVIDDIAFQTNLLALNAGVEAARAGESGRGFAVVASEVRALAQRASESAREIKDLISKSGQQVNEGGMLVSETGDALAEIINRIRKVSELVSNIAASMREQSTGLEEINSGINELDKVTQQNAAVIEETSAASQALSKEAERLSSTLDRFRLGGDKPVAAAAAPVSAFKSSAGGGASSRGSAAISHDAGWQDY
ncbi:methyl-accepting chemotaxis protein [Chachezhania sediminis]|uniref:methyl-accepting chemotaxis protein n=1 Tax=Chachezhania sediminis TaxID=2599291 RepID=UPI00131E044A|nr:HAMP domain-containing methyl-accepting chemotaxis protein [Chachezhania sediminis]